MMCVFNAYVEVSSVDSSLSIFTVGLKMKYKLLYVVQNKKATAFSLAYPKFCLPPHPHPPFLLSHLGDFFVLINLIPINLPGLNCYFLRKAFLIVC